MKFVPKSEKEIAEASLWPNGEYAFEIIEAADKVSKTSGNEMIELKMKVYNDEGAHIFVNDYLLESMAYKLRHAAVACNALDKYEAGSLSSHDFMGQAGRVKLKIQKSKDPQYADKNVIGDYVVKKDGEETPVSSNVSGTPIHDDTIPF